MIYIRRTIDVVKGGINMTVRKSIILSSEMDKRIKEECKRLAVSQSNLISFALDSYLRKVESKELSKEESEAVGGQGGSPLAAGSSLK